MSRFSLPLPFKPRASSGYLDGTPAGMQPPAAPQVALPATGPACHRPIDFCPKRQPRRFEETSTPSAATAAPIA
ncbi:uncharacterized protein TrAFT101_002518 [Trichoderma asperellum]|uniref:uncharacterized protein n=1 Tax=Trichoderma asperellum TaxID=101201 RepID=UPI00332584EC|nr:hypothetical protein TrAFT101_002518 [Trichoderma asperellum]